MTSFAFPGHLKPDSLWFRAACHEGAATGVRPIKDRVIERLARDPATEEIAQDIVGTLSPSSPAAFFAALIADVRWRTLVVESVASEKRWSDLKASVFASARDRIKAWWEKVEAAGAKAAEHVVTAAASAAGAVVLTLTVVPRIAGPLKLPVEATVNDLGLRINPDMKPVALQLVGPDGLSVPVTFKTSDLAPLRVEASLAGGCCQDVGRSLKGAGATLRATSKSLSAIAEQATQANDEIRRVRADLTGGLYSVKSAVVDLKGSLDKGVETANDMADTAGALQRTARMGLPPTLVTEMTLGPREKKPLELVREDGTHGVVACVFDVGVDLIEDSVRVRMSGRGACAGQTISPDPMRRADTVGLRGWPFDVTLQRVDRALFASDRRVRLRFTRTGDVRLASDEKGASNTGR